MSLCSTDATPSRAQKTVKSNNLLRIIGGKFRGRKLSFADLPGLRPTGDRLRETLFNWLNPYMPGSRCLDLYTGSGALALESLSRDASEVTALDRMPQVISTLQSQVVLLQSAEPNLHLDLHNANAINWLSQPPSMPYDIVFVDPPFGLNLWQQSIDLLVKNNWLNKGAAIYIESGRDCPYIAPKEWRLHREKRAGKVNCRLYFYEYDK